MVTETKIGWTDATVNPLRVLLLGADGEPLAKQPGPWRSGVHCEHVTEECRFCWAECQNKTRGTRLDFKPGHRKRLRAFVDEEKLLSPLRLNRSSMIFPCSMTDIFLDLYTDDMVARVVAMMVAARQHFFQPLTKRSARMRALLNSIEFWQLVARRASEMLDVVGGLKPSARTLFIGGTDPCEPVGPYNPPPNIMWGVSVGFSQALERVLDLLATPAALRNVSYEPALGPVDFSWAVTRNRLEIGAAFLRHAQFAPGLETIRPIDQIIFGGGGRGRQRCDVDWARPVLRDCISAGAAFFLKQTGSNAFDRGVPIRLHPKDRKGERLDAIPEDLRVRQMPPAIAAWLTREVLQ